MRLSVVMPCYNEEEVLEETTRRLLKLFSELIEKKKINGDSRIYFVDDGSRDRTWEIIEKLAGEHHQVCGIKLSRNRGHQNALLAGLLNAEGDALVSLDADLQDDISVMEKMLDKHREGCDIVYGIRKHRDTDTKFKRVTAQGFYKLMGWGGVDIIYNHPDYRLMSRRAIEHLREFKEVNLFIRGIVPLIGFKSGKVYYDRAERYAGRSKYPLKKLLAFAWNGITSFSILPLRLITVLGFVTSVFTFFMICWILAVKFLTGKAVPGWASTVLPIYFLGGIQILSIGVIGEYLGKIYEESKARPRFIIEKVTETPEGGEAR